MRPVGVGLVGLGGFGQRHLAALANTPSARLVAICSRTPERTANIARDYGVARWYTDFRQLVNDPEVEVVDVCTSDAEHMGPAVAAAEAGKHVFLEKPIATSLADGEKIIAAVKKAGVIFMVGHILRFDERHVWAKRRIEHGELGRLASMYLKRNVGRGSLFRGNPVSPILRTQIHDIDLALWLSGEKVVDLYTVSHRAAEGPIPDVVWTILRFASGLVASIQTVWLLPAASPRSVESCLEIDGTKGVVRIDSTDQGVSLWTDACAAFPDTSLVGGIAGAALKNELEYFMGCVQEGRQPSRVTTEEAWEAFRIACLALAAPESGQHIKV